ncbi:TIGR02436 family protein [Prevotella sp. DNF00663]|nr:TIGR02436 family protein [Prevotella sp. DNF00663]
MSRKDFLLKCTISLKECNETLYWLDLLLKTNYITNSQYEILMKECSELRKLLISITKTTKESLNKI